MKKYKTILFFLFLALSATGLIVYASSKTIEDRIVGYVVDPGKQDIAFYWKNDTGGIIRNIQNLKTHVESKNAELVFAMNGGMYRPGNVPQGLYIEQSQMFTPLDTASGEGNFYLKPNGIFYITVDRVPVICRTENFTNTSLIRFATQSGPMLITDGEIHPAFKKGSMNLHVRNGVGILPDNKVVFAISKSRMNFYDFASYFKSLGCKNALYLDGYVSRMYLPEKEWIQMDGDLSVIIAVIQSH